MPELHPQPPPMPRDASGRWKLVAFLLGAIAYTLVLYRFQSYQERNHMSAMPYLLFAGILLLLGFLAGLAAYASPIKTAGYLIFGMLATHAYIVYLDWQKDPTDHNLLPFEFVYLFVLGSPAYLGGWLSRFASRES